MQPKLTRDNSALIVVDMQNAYLHPDGSFARLWGRMTADGSASAGQLDLSLLRRAIPGCKRLIATAHAAAVPVIYLTYVYRSDHRDGGVLIDEINPALKDVGYVVEGTWDAEIIDELKPQPGDLVVRKPRYSGFYGTDLDAILRSMNIRTLVVCGVTTHFCVECTARDAHMRDYRVFIASDATDEVSEAWKQMSLASFAAGFGWVIDSAEVSRLWGAG